MMNHNKLHLIATAVANKVLNTDVTRAVAHVNEGNTMKLLNSDLVRTVLNESRLNINIPSNDIDVVKSIIEDNYFRVTFKELVEGIVENWKLYR